MCDMRSTECSTVYYCRGGEGVFMITHMQSFRIPSILPAVVGELSSKCPGHSQAAGMTVTEGSQAPLLTGDLDRKA